MTNLNTGVFKSYDIRGLYPQDINEETFELIVKAIYTFFLRDLKKDRLTVAVGQDMRVSSPSLFQVAKKALMELGANVVDVGLVSTPTFYYATLNYGYDVGIQISASHNPKDYNGIKFVKRVGDKLVKIAKNTGMTDVKQIAVSGDFAPAMDGGMFTEKHTMLQEEFDQIAKSFDFKSIKPFKVVADAANAMGALYLDELFKHIPGTLVKMNFELDGTFPVHQADPLQAKNLVDIQKKVVEEKADLGLAPDGDGDRMFFIDEKGQVIPPTLITSIITKELLKENPGERILIDIRYIRNATKVCTDLGGTYSISPVGHALITKQLNDENCIFAGESSGHFYFRATGGAESSVRVVLYVLKALGEAGKPMSELVADFMTSYESGEFNFVMKEGTNVPQILDTILAGYKDGELSRLDGISVTYPDWRFNIRTSNTEPLLRLNVEGKDKPFVMAKLEELSTKIKAQGATPHD